MGGVLFFLFMSLVIAAGTGLYFLPTVVAKMNRHPSLGGIFVLNLFLGWSLLGWIGAMVWACIKPQPVVVVPGMYVAQPYGSQPMPPAYPPPHIYAPPAQQVLHGLPTLPPHAPAGRNPSSPEI